MFKVFSEMGKLSHNSVKVEVYKIPAELFLLKVVINNKSSIFLYLPRNQTGSTVEISLWI